MYTPGTMIAVTRLQAGLLRRAWNGDTEVLDEALLLEANNWFLEHARKAVAARKQWLAESYRPECLTVYLSNQCALRCAYCFAAPARTLTSGRPCLHPEVFAAAAELVGCNCAGKGRAFQLCCHGGGEPTLHWRLLLQLVRISKAIAKRNSVPWNGYIATNGVIPLKRAAEMATIFGTVGLSCDGPPDIQDRQRPLSHGGPTSFWVLRTADAVKGAGARLRVRATITPETLSRQTEILEYLVTELGADSITFEPVYDLGSRRRHDVDPEEWAAQFMRARQEALRHNVELEFSGFRPEEQHGPYCNTLRQSLHLTPDGRATNCFLVVNGDHPGHNKHIIGGFDRRSGRFTLDQAKIALLRERTCRIGPICQDCFAAYHCARSCPDACVLGDGHRSQETTTESSFRCRLNRAIGHALLNQAALDLFREESGVCVSAAQGTPVADAIAATLGGLSRPDREEALRTFEASHPHYRLENRGLPRPLWETKGFQYDGKTTWDRLCRIVNERSPRPFSMYIHIPFCEKRCDFCDCYTTSVGPGHPLHADYVKRLCLDLQQWMECTSLSAWPVTTIHFGGGTPNALQPSLFAHVIETIRAEFHRLESTEWALESTVRQLTGPHLDFLWDLGFRRLHVGVQTLEEPLRREIGRRDSSETVLERIADCLSRGFVTTVDLLYGLPGQTVAGFFPALNS